MSLFVALAVAKSTTRFIPISKIKKKSFKRLLLIRIFKNTDRFSKSVGVFYSINYNIINSYSA